jgi:secondary thiamine-phosphate synthase enzyme
MEWHKAEISIETHGKGLYSFTDQVKALIKNWGVQQGMCYLFVQHTSASMVISEDYDHTAKLDMETFMDRLAPEGQAWHRHTLEGADDSPSHIRAMLTQVDLSIPVDEGRLSLGTWQGIYLFEHRQHGHRRSVLVRCLSVD